jgi:hypothetical protein
MAEHVLRMKRADLRAVLMLVSSQFDDVELVLRWRDTKDQEEDGTLAMGVALGRQLWSPEPATAVDSVDDLLEIGRISGWDPPGVVRAATRLAESLLDQRAALVEFIDKVRGSVVAELGVEDAQYLWLTNVALALAGDPWRARDELEHSLEGGGPLVRGSLAIFAAIRVLCGDYSQAIESLAPLATGDTPQTHLYLALLRATGRAEEARNEHTRLLGTAPTTEPPTHPEKLAREYLLARLREF